MLYLGIYHKDITIVVNQDIARNKVPDLVFSISESSFCGSLPKAESSHVGVNHNLRGRMGISNAWLSDDWLYGATIEACKTIKGIGSVWEKEIFRRLFTL